MTPHVRLLTRIRSPMIVLYSSISTNLILVDHIYILKKKRNIELYIEITSNKKETRKKQSFCLLSIVVFSTVNRIQMKEKTNTPRERKKRRQSDMIMLFVFSHIDIR
jgi:hypothetical protein